MRVCVYEHSRVLLAALSFLPKSEIFLLMIHLIIKLQQTYERIILVCLSMHHSEQKKEREE